MYQNAAILATLLVVYSAERSWLSGPMLFSGAGLILGPVDLDLLQLNVAADGLRTMAEATLALLGIPEWLLLV
jgi:sodium/hydrogen antiporter